MHTHTQFQEKGRHLINNHIPTYDTSNSHYHQHIHKLETYSSNPTASDSLCS